MVRSTNSRCGLTFIEVLLMVALLFFLAGLLIASVAGVRRAAGDTISMNNLKQLALATHAFHDAYNGFPPAVGKVGNNEGTAHFLHSVESLL